MTNTIIEAIGGSGATPAAEVLSQIQTKKKTECSYGVKKEI